MNKSLCKAIMVRYRLKNRFLRLKTKEAKNTYKIQRNYCVSFLRYSKRCFYENLDTKLIIDNKKFWNQVKPIFADKTPSNTNITLLENGNIITNPSACAEVLNNFFSDSVNDLDIDRSLHVDTVINVHDSIDKAIKMYKNHPSVISINKLTFAKRSFSFRPISEEHVQTAISNIDTSKSY